MPGLIDANLEIFLLLLCVRVSQPGIVDAVNIGGLFETDVDVGRCANQDVFHYRGGDALLGIAYGKGKELWHLLVAGSSGYRCP